MALPTLLHPLHGALLDEVRASALDMSPSVVIGCAALAACKPPAPMEARIIGIHWLAAKPALRAAAAGARPVRTEVVLRDQAAHIHTQIAAAHVPASMATLYGVFNGTSADGGTSLRRSEMPPGPSRTNGNVSVIHTVFASELRSRRLPAA